MKTSIQIKPTPRRVLLLIFCAVLLSISTQVSGQSVARGGKANWQGHWNWAIYGKDKSELPPAYRDVEHFKEHTCD